MGRDHGDFIKGQLYLESFLIDVLKVFFRINLTEK